MIFKNFIYFIKEALKSLYRNSWMSLASVGVVSLTLLLLGAFILINFNVDLFTREIKDQVEILVYVQDDIEEGTLDNLRVRLIEVPEVEEVRYISRTEALERLKESFGDRAALLDGYEDDTLNPLRDSFEIKTGIPEDVSKVALRIEGFAGVDLVDYGEPFVENLFNVTNGIRLTVTVFMFALGLTAVFLIANTIKSAVFSRSNEIKIMKYVGATDWFIRWPFLFEGVLLGLLGALIPLIFLNYGYSFIIQWLQGQVMFMVFVPPQMVMGELIKVLLPIGIIIGGIGSVFSTRRFLKV